MNLDVVKLNPTEWIQRAYRLNLTRIPSSYPTSCPTFRIWLIENKQIPDSLSRPHWRYVRWSLFFVSCGMNSIIRSVHSTCITSSNVLRFFEKIVFLFLSYRERSRKFASLSLSNRMNNRFGSSLVEPFKEAFAIFSLELRKKNLPTVKLTFYSCRWRKKGERDVTPRSIYPFKRTEYNLLLLVTGTRN